MGLFSGLIAGVPVSLAAMLLGEGLDVGLAAALLTPFTGLIYVLSVNRFVARLCVQPPPALSGALVGGGVAALVGVAVWAFAGIFNSTITGAATEAVRFAWTMLPQAVGGGMLGGFIAGAALGAVGMKGRSVPGEQGDD